MRTVSGQEACRGDRRGRRWTDGTWQGRACEGRRQVSVRGDEYRAGGGEVIGAGPEFEEFGREVGGHSGVG